MLVIASVVVFVLLFSLARYYLIHQAEDGREPALAGDVICGSLVSQEAQDACCRNVHKEDATSECAGSWNYIEGARNCQYLCSGALPSCKDDVKRCPDGKNVIRNPNKECKFDRCDE